MTEEIPTQPAEQQPQRDIYKTLFLLTVSFLAANLAWSVLHLISDGNYVTEAELREAIKTAPYPWISDRGKVLGHLSETEQHESDAEKRNRIREELTATTSILRGEVAQVETSLSAKMELLETKIGLRLDEVMRRLGEMETPRPRP